MKNKFKKDFKIKINKLFKSIKTSNTYIFLVKSNFILRIFVWTFLIIFAFIAYIIPPIPFATLSLILWLSMFLSLKKVKSKILYFLNKTRIKHLFFLIYIEYFKKKQKIQIKKYDF